MSSANAGWGHWRDRRTASVRRNTEYPAVHDSLVSSPRSSVMRLAIAGLVSRCDSSCWSADLISATVSLRFTHVLHAKSRLGT
jgi:hypothetical protein